MRKIRLLICRQVPVGQKLLPWPWGGRAKVQSVTATKKGRGVPVREKTFMYSAMSITLKCSYSAGASLQRRFYMPVGSPVVSSTTTAREATSSSPKMGTGASRKSSLASIVRSMGALCTSRRCGPKKRASAYGNARNVTRSTLMGRFQVRQPLPANAVPIFSAKSCDRILSADSANLNFSFG